MKYFISIKGKRQGPYTLQELKAENVKIHVFDTNHGFANVKKELVETIANWIKEKK